MGGEVNANLLLEVLVRLLAENYALQDEIKRLREQQVEDEGSGSVVPMDAGA